jgi:Tfp pilus assembly protein PilZ
MNRGTGFQGKLFKMNKNRQAEIADEIVMSVYILDLPQKMMVGAAYEKIAKRKGTEFRDKVKQLESDAFDTQMARKLSK